MESQTNGEEQGNRAGNDWRPGAWTGIMALGGLVALAGGLLLAAAPRLTPQLAWIAKSLSRIGIDSGAVIACGVVSIGLAILSQQLIRAGSQMRSAEATNENVELLAQSVQRMASRITRVHVQLNGLMEGTKTLLRLAQDQSSVEAAGMQVDATYRLAASMDQLGRRLESRLSKQESHLDDRIEALRAGFDDAQQQIETWMQSAGEDLSSAELPAQPDAPPLLPSYDEEEELEVSVTLEDFGEESEGTVSLEGLDEDDDGEASPEGADFEAEIELDFEFEFEAEPEALLDAEPTTPEEVIEEFPFDEGLGLLDELDEFGTARDNDHPLEVEDLPSLIAEHRHQPAAMKIEEAPRVETIRLSKDLFSDEALEAAWRQFRGRKRI